MLGAGGEAQVSSQFQHILLVLFPLHTILIHPPNSLPIITSSSAGHKARYPPCFPPFSSIAVLEVRLVLISQIGASRGERNGDQR